jgi:hypothetical protein
MVVIMADKWICMMVNTSFHHGDKTAVTTELRKIFSNDLKEIRLICDEIMWKSGEYYCLILCSNYDSHIPLLKENALFFKVIPSLDNPNWLTSDEVEKFTSSVEKAGIPVGLSKGDIVFVKEGYLKNLYGLVIGNEKGKTKRFKVSFHFYLKRFVANITAVSLQFVDNLFKYRKFPITREDLLKGKISKNFVDKDIKEVLSKIASEHKIHRKVHRECIKAK